MNGVERLCRTLLEKPLYTTGIAAYRLGVRLASLKNPKARKLNSGLRNSMRLIDNAVHPDERWIWIHAASLGEFEQGRPMIERIKAQYPKFKIMLTFFSPSGYEVRKNYQGADCVCYLPFDTPLRVHRFLDKLNPEIAIFVKYEFWRNYLTQLHKRGIPTFLISGIFRKNQIFFRPAGKWYSHWLRNFTHMYLQDENSRRLLKGIGIENTSVCGDTRFDRVAEIKAQQKQIPLLEQFTEKVPGTESDKERPLVMMAGSSWPADEAVYASWFDAHPEVKLVIAPHEFNAERLEKLRSLFKNGVVMMSEAEKDPNAMIGKQVMVIDCFGLLSSAYAYADFAYVGGAFGAGLHNINEAAVYDIPVIYGPNNAKFIEADELQLSGGGFPIPSRQGFEEIADRMLNDRAFLRNAGSKAGAYIRSKIGATDRILSALAPYLSR